MMNLGKLKASVLRQNHRGTSTSSTNGKDSLLGYANGDLESDNNYSVRKNNNDATTTKSEQDNLKVFQRTSRLNILKTLRRKLPWNSLRQGSGGGGGGSGGGGGGGGGGTGTGATTTTTSDGNNVLCSSSAVASKQGKSSKSRAICPMPSMPIKALKRLGSAPKDNNSEVVLSPAASVGDLSRLPPPTDDTMPLRTVIVRRQSAAGFLQSESSSLSVCHHPTATTTTASHPDSGKEYSRVTSSSSKLSDVVRMQLDDDDGPSNGDYILTQYDIPLPKVRSLTVELFRLSKYGWYWGPISRSEAEEKLMDQADGAFLVRDSSDDRYLLSLSFRSFGKTLHTRIEHCNGMFSFYAQPESEGHESIVELIEHSMSYSQSGIFCYSRARTPGAPSYPVRLTKPVSRFTQVRTLQYLCRFVIRQYTRVDLIQELPLPTRIRGYIEEGHY